ncbi:thiamine-phosphate kinase [Ottowia oryzae]
MGEFELIARYFKRNTALAQAAPAPAASLSIAKDTPGVALGIGDDCALLTPAPGQQLAISTDMLVEGRHFFADVDPAALGHKALAVNLSDLAAMGAQPLAFTLALALPPARAGDDAWMSGFARGLFALADEHRCALVGGDTTAGPLNISITVLGQVPAGQALRRDGARAGDDIWVSGTLGDARLALLALQGQLALPPDRLAALRQRLERPTPRVALGTALRGIATSAIDLSDGLAGDLRHVLSASGVGAVLDAQALRAAGATSATSATGPAHAPSNDAAQDLQHTLTGGDDYELLFTAAPAQREAVRTAGAASATAVTRIGRIEAAQGAWLMDAQGGRQTLSDFRSFDHFA